MQDTNQTQQLDPTIVNMARAIKSVETKGQSDPYRARGASGEYGAYQYTAPTWKADSTKYLGQEVPLEQATVEQQNMVAYHKIADLKAQGYKPDQVASIWNHGSPDYEGVVGTNSKGVNYNTPQYVKAVTSAYTAYKNGQVPTLQPTSSTVGSTNKDETPKDPTLGQELSGRLADAGSALSRASTGEINPISGLLQTGGAIGGAVGDVVNKGLELIPGVKWLEGKIGQGVSSLAQTPIGQSVVSSMQAFSKAHPELSDDIGAGFNIATAIPILRGLGVAKDVVLSGAGKVLKDIAAKGFADGIESDVGRLKSTARIFAKNGGRDTLDTGIQERLLPDIKDGKYANAEVIANTTDRISDIDSNQLQPILEQISAKQGIGQNLSTLKKLAIQEAENDIDLKESGMVPKALKQIEDRFNGWQHSYGDNIDLATENRLKIGSGKFSDWNTPEGSADKSIYRALQQNIEEVAKKHGLNDVHAINQKMGSLIRYRQIMSALDGKAIKVGVKGKLLRKGLSVGAGYAASSLGGGVVGGLGMGYLTDIADKGVTGIGRNIKKGILERTGVNATKVPLKKVIKRGTGLLVGSQLQKQNH